MFATGHKTQDPKGFVAVTSKDVDEANVAGAIIWWRLEGTVDGYALGAAWRTQGMDEDDLPAMPNAEKATRRAVKEQEEKHRLVRPVEVGAVKVWYVVDEKVQGDVLSYEEACRVRCTGEGVEVEPADHPLAEDVRSSFYKHLSELQTGDISNWLCKRVDAVGAVGLRDTGGIYFVPKTGMEEWRKVVAAMHEASRNRLFEVPALPSAEAIEAIMDAVAQEAEQVAERLEKEFHSGELGARGLENRTVRCDRIKAKVEAYEALMGASLDKVKAKLDTLRQDLVVALLSVEDDNAA